jgi:hypothetical protein
VHATLASPRSLMLLDDALRDGAGLADLRPLTARGIAPVIACCAAAVRPLMDVDAATAAIEGLLDGDADPDGGAADRARRTFARLVFLGHTGLQSHADLHGYDPSRRLQSVLSVYAPTQVEGVARVVEAGAGRRCLQACVMPLANAVEVAIVEVETDDVAFVEAVAAWTGISLALYAIARAVVDPEPA